MYSAFSRGTVIGVLAAPAAEIVWVEAEGVASTETHTSPDAVMHGVFLWFAAEWLDFSATPREYVRDGQAVVAVGDYSATLQGEPARRSRRPLLTSGSCARELWSVQQFTDNVLVQRAMR